MNHDHWIGELKVAQSFFNNSTACLTEADSGFRPTPESLSVAEQVAHAAHTVDWFFEGVTGEQGFRMDFPEMEKEFRAVKSLGEARTWFAKAMESAQKTIADHPGEFWNAPIPEGPMFGGYPRHFIVGAISDHTAHHRGALTVLARLCGRTPAMPYGEM